MMATFRKLGNTKASKAFLTLLAFSFVAWGVGGYLMHTTGVAVVTVNGEDVSPAQLDQAYKNRLQQLESMLGGKIPAAQLAQLNLGNQVLKELVARVAMRSTAQDLGLVPATRQLQDSIMGMRVFVDETGKFDTAKYRSVLAQNGRSPEQFEDEMGKDLSVRTLAQLIALPAPAPAAIAPQAVLDEASLKLEVVTLTPAMVGTPPTPSAEQLERFYKDNEQVYVTPEKRDVNVLMLSREAVAKTVSIPENRLQDEYHANAASYAVPEKRTVRHILLDTEDAAAKLAGKIHTLKDMEALAKTESKDPGSKDQGGLLGDITQKDVVETFGKAAFALPAGQLSAPVQSPFGWHLIWVEKVTPGFTKTYAQARDEILAQLKDAEADDTLAKLAGKMDEKIAGGATLTEIAKAEGLPLQHHPMVTAKDELLTPDVLQAAFAAEAGRMAPPLNGKDGSVTYVEAAKVYASQLPDLASQKDRVTKDWQRTQVQVALQQRADQILGNLRAPGMQGAADVIAKLGLTGATVSTQEISRLATVPEWLQSQVLNLYPLPVGAALPTALKDGDTWRVVRLVDRQPAKLNPTELASAAKLYQRRLQSDFEGLLLGYLVQQANVKINQPRVNQVLGTGQQQAE